MKLPVRLLGFALVTNLELIMKDIIISKHPDDESWLELLSAGRGGKVLEKRNNFSTSHMDPMLIELTDFCDKQNIVKKILNLPNSFLNELSSIEKEIRNPLAHAATFITDDSSLERFIQTLEKTRGWIKTLSAYLN